MHWKRTHIPRWVPTFGALSLLLIGLNGCAILAGSAALGAAGGAIASRDIRVRPGASVRVQFTRPPEIPVVLLHETDTTWLRRTEYVIGRVERTRGDTLWIELSESRSAISRVMYGRRQAQVAVDQRMPGTSVVVLANRPMYIVAGAMAGVVLGTVLGLGIYLIYCGSNDCMS